MVGPEDADSLAKVQGVTRAFNTTHILPTFHSVSKESEENTVFYVSIEHLREQAQVPLAHNTNLSRNATETMDLCW